ncbi:MAG: hypothetical protein VB115_14395 [Christensenellaceae bacterium]|nr:hypothetical protein [Christensenellaceae bacterium]
MTHNSLTDNALRKRATQRGFFLRKSRCSISLDNHGEYMVLDAFSGAVVAGERYQLTAEDVDQFLSGK